MVPARLDGFAERRWAETRGHPNLENMHPTPTLRDVMQAIAASREALEQKIDSMGIDLGLLHTDHECLAEVVTATERDSSSN
ncbi:hypothetical protein NDU88_010814 [Pleurodeles waltl]|uniref:Uncharacterized protein n=1 Tax=Pleurodeles waltl TaxID=8319 RepID=A0AAV7QVF5_PLEWA|nr:hypothetical protein NDU88_010814 [Pleurodeles waltl]